MSPDDAPDALNDSDAMLVWARAAQLQHGQMDTAMSQSASSSQMAELRLPSSESLSLSRVAEAGLEAGLASEFIALALAEKEALTPDGSAAIRGAVGGEVARVLRSEDEGIQLSILVAAPGVEILAALGRLLAGMPWLLELDRVVQPLEHAPGVARWRIPNVMAVAEAMDRSGALPKLCYRAAVLGITHLHTMVVPRPEQGVDMHEVVFSLDLRAARATRVARMPRERAMLSAGAGVATLAAAAALFGGAAALALPVLGGAFALAAGVAAVIQPITAWRYRAAVSVLRSEVQDMGTAVHNDAQCTNSAQAEQVMRAAMPAASLHARLRG